MGVIGEREQVLAPNHLYSLNEAMARTGLSEGAFRNARRNGLTVLYFSTRAFIHWQDLIDFIRSRSKKEHRNARDK